MAAEPMNLRVPRATRRNRMLLAASAILSVPLASWGTGIFDRQRHPGPLLVAVDELPVNVGVYGSKMVSEIVPIATMMRASIEPVIVSPTPEYEFDDTMQWFNGRPVRPVRVMRMTVTAYSPDERSCGEFADGVTASGYSVWTNGMKSAAADTSILPFGTLISVPGYDNGAVVPVLDRGGAIKGRRLDMLYPTHQEARAWGTQRLDVTIWEYADGRPNDFKARFNGDSAVRN